MSAGQDAATNDQAGGRRLSVRLCRLHGWSDFTGYGFNLFAIKGRRGHYVQNVERGSPAETGGLRVGDCIVEVNGINISNDNHQQVKLTQHQFSSVQLITCFTQSYNKNYDGCDETVSVLFSVGQSPSVSDDVLISLRHATVPLHTNGPANEKLHGPKPAVRVRGTTRSAIYRVRQIKVIPCCVLLISQRRTGIFTRKFTVLFLIHIYA